MYTKFQLAKKYLHYLLTAENSKGHGIHSPFVFDFIKNVLRDKKKYSIYKPIEKLREKLKTDKRVIEVKDFGAGSTVMKSNTRKVKDIAASSLKPKKYAQLLFRIANYYQPKYVIELGTSLGITTAYLASANPQATIYTCEGDISIAGIASNTFKELGLKNIELVQGDFAATLPGLFSTLPATDFAFIDGNHKKEPTMQYFKQLLEHATPAAILIFDDIHWSREMEEAWEYIQQHNAVTLSIDLFFIGLVFLSPDFKVKQHFTIRF